MSKGCGFVKAEILQQKAKVKSRYCKIHFTLKHEFWTKLIEMSPFCKVIVLCRKVNFPKLEILLTHSLPLTYMYVN